MVATTAVLPASLISIPDALLTTALITTGLLTTALLTTGLVAAHRRRRGTGVSGTRTVARTRTSLLRSARELLLEPPDYWRLDRRGRRTHELAHFLKLGHDSLALYTELLSEFVNPDLRHYAPLPTRRCVIGGV
jgi:hypothetical protein